MKARKLVLNKESLQRLSAGSEATLEVVDGEEVVRVTDPPTCRCSRHCSFEIPTVVCVDSYCVCTA